MKLLRQKFWNNKEYKLESSINLAEIMAEKYINIFWKDIVKDIKNDQYILFLFRVKYTNNHYSTIGNLQKIKNLGKRPFPWHISGSIPK